MPLAVSYMGTKKQLAPYVASIVSSARPGPFLDLFAGMCSVSVAVGQSRNIWCNDVQEFASNVGRAFFTSQEGPINFERAIDIVRPHYIANISLLSKRFSDLLAREFRELESPNLESFCQFEQSSSHVGNSQELNLERANLALGNALHPYRLFTLTFCAGYFGYRQCTEIDSIRFAIDKLSEEKLISSEQANWMCLALCQSLSKVASSTGHFAQYLKPNKKSFRRIVSQRRRSVWNEWISALHQMWPVGSRSWRGRNRAFQTDAIQLLQKLKGFEEVPSVIYADPPYTADHYSRYYHVYETLILYDYPSAEGIGRYRPDRFVSMFSIKNKIWSSINSLIKHSSELGSKLVLSYPSNGLIENSEREIIKLLQTYFPKSSVKKRLNYNHSSLGASKGHQKVDVEELIFVAG